MKKKLTVLSFLIVSLLAADVCHAYWIWSPDLGKWINPKKSSKDTPEEQFTWAQQFYDQKNWDRAIEEFEKLPEAFPKSRMAAEGVYYSGLSWEAKQDLAKAADAYQRLIDRYPYSDRIKDAVKREFEIANQFASGEKMKLLGIPLLSGQDKAIELYKHIVKNAPFGTYGDQAQFQIGEVHKAMGDYEEAQKAYQQVVDEYPNSELVTKARYQIAYVAMQASKKSQYDEQYAQRAIDQFEDFKKNYPQDQQAIEADESIRALRAKKAQQNFEVGSFYEKQGKRASAKVYYEEITQKYGDTPIAETAKKRLQSILQSESGPPKSESKPWFRLW